MYTIIYHGIIDFVCFYNFVSTSLYLPSQIRLYSHALLALHISVELRWKKGVSSYKKTQVYWLPYYNELWEYIPAVRHLVVKISFN